MLKEVFKSVGRYLRQEGMFSGTKNSDEIAAENVAMPTLTALGLTIPTVAISPLVNEAATVAYFTGMAGLGTVFGYPLAEKISPYTSAFAKAASRKVTDIALDAAEGVTSYIAPEASKHLHQNHESIVRRAGNGAANLATQATTLACVGAPVAAAVAMRRMAPSAPFF